MYCDKCGSQVNDGEKFCTRCGAPVRTPFTPPAPAQGGGYGGMDNAYTVRTAVRGGGTKWLIFALAASVLLIISAYFSGLGMSASADGQTISASSPVILYGSVLSQLSGALQAASGMMGLLSIGGLTQVISSLNGIAGWFGFYSFMCFLIIAALIVSAFMTVAKKPVGIFVGLGACALGFIGSVINIIVIFSANSSVNSLIALAGSSSDMPSIIVFPDLWVWLTLITSAATAAVLIIKNREILSR